MKELLKSCVDKSSDWIEIRYHKRRRNSIVAMAGRIDSADSIENTGVGVRALVDGCFGFASTDDLSEKSIMLTVGRAADNARSLSKLKKSKVAALPATKLATTDFTSEGYSALLEMKLQDKMQHVIGLERETAAASQLITRATCRYTETFEDKIIITSDGALAQQRLAQPEFVIHAIAQNKGDNSTYNNSMGVSGNWECLFNHPRAEGIVENTAGMAVDLLKAGYLDGGVQTVIMSPAIVGLLSHEAVGHTVEADFVLSGSVAQGKIGERVASELVTLCDSGDSPYSDHATGRLMFDDEGVPCRTINIIENGILKSYLHNRESAAHYGVEPTGNARAWLYTDDPLIRMRNTYVTPGSQTLDEIIASTEDGVLLEGALNGQADATGEFMFGVGHAVKIKNGKRAELLREVTVSGIAFDVLGSVDAVSSEFQWDLGSGYCGKWQPAKVDAGGPYIRARATLGGKQ